MEQINNTISEKLIDQPFTESVKSLHTYSNKEGVINNIDKESSNFNLNKNEYVEKKGKVIMLNYFDTETGNYKKLLVKKINNNHSIE